MKSIPINTKMKKEHHMYSKQQLHRFKHHFYRQENKRPFIRLVNGQNQHLFNTIHQCAEAFGVKTKTIWDAFIHGDTIHGYQVIPIYNHEKEARMTRIVRRVKTYAVIETTRPVDVFDITTAKIRHFSSATEAAKFMEVTTTNTLNRLSAPGKYSIVKRRYIVVDKGGADKLITSEVIGLLRARQGRHIVVLDTHQMRIERFIGLSAFLRQYDCRENKTHIIYALKTHGIYLHKPGVYLLKETEPGVVSSNSVLWARLFEKVNEK